MERSQTQDLVVRVADQVAALYPHPSSLLLAGVHTRGVHIAHRLAKVLAERTGQLPLLGTVDANLLVGY